MNHSQSRELTAPQTATDGSYGLPSRSTWCYILAVCVLGSAYYTLYTSSSIRSIDSTHFLSAAAANQNLAKSNTGVEEDRRQQLCSNVSAPEQGALPAVCDRPRFQSEVTHSNSSLPTHLLMGCKSVFYNRIPKCASRTVIRTLEALSNQTHAFHTLFLKGPSKISKEHLQLEAKDVRTNNDDPFVFCRHYYFIDFDNMYGDQAVYINVIREPAEWFQSAFFWFMSGSAENPHPRAETRGVFRGVTTLEECLEQETCVWTIIKRLGPTRFLCGQSQACFLNRTFAYEEAVRHLDQYYVAVGLMENLDQFTELLEFLMPRMFAGFTDQLTQIGAIGLNSTRTVEKVNISPAILKKLRHRLHFQYKLYNYIKQKFNFMVTAMRRQKKREQLCKTQ